MVEKIRVLNSANINLVIENYISSIKEIPLQFTGSNFLHFFESIKRNPIGRGPYPDVSLFEVSNRIMTDLVLIFGVKHLLNGVLPEINFKEYKVEFGNENRNDNDIEALDSNCRLRGEVFNVSKSYFAVKKSYVLRKMRAQSLGNDKLLIICNKEALRTSKINNLLENEYSLLIDLESELKAYLS